MLGRILHHQIHQLFGECQSTLGFKSSLFLIKRSKTFLKLIGGIRVDRDAKSFEFVSHALEVLDKGGIIGVFPQARLPVKGMVFPFTVSTAFIATHSDAPIIPVYTDGNYGITKRTGVVIGAPICLNDYAQDGLTEQEQMAHLTKVLEEKVFVLKEELN